MGISAGGHGGGLFGGLLGWKHISLAHNTRKDLLRWTKYIETLLNHLGSLEKKFAKLQKKHHVGEYGNVDVEVLSEKVKTEFINLEKQAERIFTALHQHKGIENLLKFVNEADWTMTRIYTDISTTGALARLQREQAKKAREDLEFKKKRHLAELDIYMHEQIRNREEIRLREEAAQKKKEAEKLASDRRARRI